MRITRLYLEESLSAGRELDLGDRHARYVGRSLRMRPGDALQVFNEDDGEWLAVVEHLSRNGCRIRLTERVAAADVVTLVIQLVQGISRGDRMDTVVQKATELGVNRITPVFCDHGNVQLDSKRAEKRLDHWRKIAISACEQCGRIAPPRIDLPIALNDWFGASFGDAATRLLLAPDATTAMAASTSPEHGLKLLIGPEGGLSPKELGDAAAAGFQAVKLGPRVLRTETAAIAAVTLAQSLWGDLQA